MKHKLCFLLVVALLLGSILGCYFLFRSSNVSTPLSQFRVLIDPGHGGLDSGVVGRTTRTEEAKVNLIFSKKLQTALEQAGVEVLLTRQEESGLYDEDFTGNKKRQDMQRRGEIIRTAKVHAVISIHMNAYPDTVSRGGQVFYKPACEESHRLATALQQGFKELDPANHRMEKAGDFYVLKQAKVPAVLVECGFFSHPEEEKMLLAQDYQDKLTGMLADRLVAYLLGTVKA